MKKLLILLLFVPLLAYSVSYKDQRGIIRMIYGGDTLIFKFVGDTNQLTGNLKYFEIDGALTIDSIRFKNSVSWFSSLLTPSGSLDLSSFGNNSILIEMNDTVGWNSLLYFLNNKLYAPGIFINASSDTNKIINTSGTGKNLIKSANENIFDADQNTFKSNGVTTAWHDANGIHSYVSTTDTLVLGEDTITDFTIRINNYIIDSNIVNRTELKDSIDALEERIDIDIENLSFVLGESTLFLHSETTDISNYNQLLTTAQEDPESTDDTIVNSGDGELLIRSFVTNQLGINTIPSGTWTFMNWLSVDNATGTTTVVIRVYKRSGGVETELFNVTTPEINGTTATEYDVEAVKGDYAILTTDSLVVKYFAQTTYGVDRTVTLYYEGSANYTHIHTPLVLSLTESDPFYAADSNNIVMFPDTNTVIATKTDVKNATGECKLNANISKSNDLNAVNSTATLTAYVNTDGVSYSWNSGDGTDKEYVVLAEGDYDLIVSKAGCIDDTAYVFVSMANFPNDYNVVLPTLITNDTMLTNNHANIDVNLKVNGNSTLGNASTDITTVNGKLIVVDSSDIKTSMITWHRNDSINTAIADAWIDIKLDTMIASLTTYGFTTPDSTNFISNTNGKFEINGAFNVFWNSGSGSSVTYNIRTLKNSAEIREVKYHDYKDMIANDEDFVNINGRVDIAPSDTLRFQYYVGSTDIDFEKPSGIVFDDMPVISINIKKISK